MNFIDLIFTLILLGYLAMGAKKGMIIELLKLLGFFVAYLVAEVYYAQIAQLLAQLITHDNYAKAVGYGLVLLVGFIISFLLSYLSKLLFLVHALPLKFRIVGAIFGFMRGIVVCLIVFFFITQVFSAYLDELEDSRYYLLLQSIREMIVGFNIA